ncbi:extracellular solute-binding protein [Nocardioides glacieisoli]|uniref:Extracellular solute-binding protein n=1 Tax=Nocardioides glacieisoli TaxID=1168730 RepID=A0A4V1RKL4_9ACTN|nr:extracellular solute-binding protein [Nocardioides glacieisoli]RYB92692.1 extracellular solute-binding protein [Nocardioides glacieisoli]
METRSSTGSRLRPRSRRAAGSVAALALASSLLAACGGDGGKPELVWYINPDSGGQDAVAEKCSTDDYTISTQVLPQDAGQQRIQLARRLAAKDPSIDLMSIDPPFTAEFADAGFLAEVPQDAKTQLEEQGTFKGALDAATWNDQLVVFPFWSNTQVLWYRKSFVDKAGIDMSQPVTWDQIIDAASENDGKVAVQANKYEGYVVWINALVEGAGGTILENPEEGVDADITLGDEAGKQAAGIIEKLATSEAAPADLSVSNEGTAGSTFGSDQGSFLVNWTYIFKNYDETAPDVAEDIGYTRYPQTVEGEESRPPYGGIGIGVSAYSDEQELALEAAQCLVSPESQGINADLTGNMPASTQGYDYPKLKEQYPADLLELFQTSVDAAAPRTVTPYWSDVSGSIQNIWHPPRSVNDDTPGRSTTFIEDVLKGGDLL